MRKLIMVIVCLVIAATSYAQGNVRQIALNEFKYTLLAPSQFILTDIYGNRISTSQIKVTFCKAKVETEPERFYPLTVEGFDSVVVWKKTYPACYKVTIIGDVRNRIGGYEQMIEYVYVYNKRGYVKDRPYKKAIEKIYIDKEKPSYCSIPEKEEKVFDVVEEMPQFPGGPQALFEFIEKNIKYPAEAEDKCVQGRTIVTFVVNENGSISSVKVVKSVDPLLDREAQRIVRSMPHWIPGKQNGHAVKVKYTVPVTFKLK